jgi:hypothetical protein
MMGFGETPDLRERDTTGIAPWEFALKLDFRIMCWLSIYFRNKDQNLYTLILKTFFRHGLSLDIAEGSKKYHDLGLAAYCSARTFNEDYVRSKEGFLRLSSMYYRYIHEMSLYDRLINCTF